MTANPTTPDPARRWRSVAWVAQVVVAVVLARTLVFKFTYAPETASIFEGRAGRPPSWSG
ncbi:MAG: hypothetical protein K2V38_24475 [Gemmataceae bacterium]|nr:hypothetical protein [Gemmataceae bacterium]